VILAVAASLVLAFVPFYSGVFMGSGGQPQASSATLIQVNGYWIIILLLVPPVLTSLGFMSARRRAIEAKGRPVLLWTAVAFLFLFCLAGSFSIGAYYLPAVLALLATGIISARIHSTEK